MEYRKKAEELVKQIQRIAKQKGKLTGFTIGNTAKIDESGFYFTPIRETFQMITAGVIVYNEEQAVNVSQIVDGGVQYVLVDAEKKVSSAMSLTGEPTNIERAVRENIQKSTLWIYKGNDLSVEAVDALIMQLTKDQIRGAGAKKIAIIGAGNLGCKLALKLVERGAHVFISRRNKEKLDVVVKALNFIKPIYTTAQVTGTTDNREAAYQADILIGVSQGRAVITEDIVRNLAPGAMIIDVGKGTLDRKAIEVAEELGISIYRLDITAAFEGLVAKLWAIENIVEKRLGRRSFNGSTIVSGGLLGYEGEIIVDNIHNPHVVYGMANGSGDFIRELTEEQEMELKKIEEAINEGLKDIAHVNV